MLTAVVTVAGDSLVSVRLATVSTEPPAAEETTSGDEGEETGAAAEQELTAEEEDTGPSPIAPEAKELLWGAGAFVVLAVVMRYLIYPRLREGMKARYDAIQQRYTDADAIRDAARGDVAAYESALAEVRAEAVGRIDAARQTLEAERQARLAEVNGRIAERKAAAAAEAEAARQAAAGNVDEAVGTVASTLVQLATGKAPSSDAVQAAVAAVSGAGVRS